MEPASTLHDAPTASLRERLASIVGAGGVTDDGAEREYLAHDIAGRCVHAPALLVRPHTIEEARAAVRTAVGEGRAVVPRGGGMSYTGGYQPAGPDAVVVDLRGLDRIAPVVETDGYVVVECGCTWSKLYDALAARGLRTPFFGPLSGIAATVGGALSQHAAFFGSGEHGVSADGVLGLEVVLADGTLLRTGAWAAEGRVPFQRAYGPDLTSLFLGDCGALGVKVRAALRVQPIGHSAFASFAVADGLALVSAQSALAGLRGLAECFGFDPVANENLARAGFTLRDKAQALHDVAHATGGVKGLLAAVGLGARRTAFLEDVGFSLHLVADGPTAADAELTLARAREILAARHATEIPDSIPRATRARPFRPIKALLGPHGELWLPVHGVFPLSRAAQALAAIQAVLDGARADMDRHAVRVSMLTALVDRALLIEPQFFWRDALTPFHLRHVTPSQREAFADRAVDPVARALVHRLRHAVASAVDAAGGTHFQLGKYYAYQDQLTPVARTTLLGLKRLFDPESRMNPGALGLGQADDETSLQRRS
jgi:D-lactate dehydrogenase (cytochrome)